MATLSGLPKHPSGILFTLSRSPFVRNSAGDLSKTIHPAKPSKIAAGASASRSSSTEAEVFTAGLRRRRY
jgi:hypothetical protein